MKKINPVKKLWLIPKYNRFTAGKRPVNVTIQGDFLASRYKLGDTRLIQIRDKSLIVTFQSVELTDTSDLIGHYNICCSTQYLSFRAYCHLATFRDNRIKLKF